MSKIRPWKVIKFPFPAYRMDYLVSVLRLHLLHSPEQYFGCFGVWLCCCERSFCPLWLMVDIRGRQWSSVGLSSKSLPVSCIFPLSPHAWGMALLWWMLCFSRHLLCLHPLKINLLVVLNKCHQHPVWGEDIQITLVCSCPLYTDAMTTYGKETAWTGKFKMALTLSLAEV